MGAQPRPIDTKLTEVRMCSLAPLLIGFLSMLLVLRNSGGVGAAAPSPQFAKHEGRIY